MQPREGAPLRTVNSPDTAPNLTRDGARRDPAPGAPAAASRTNILLVDDDARSLIALRELLQGLGPNLVLANSGEEALRCVLKDDFAVILMDVRMPGLDGFETARLIRERPRSRHTPIIFLTGMQADSRSMFRGYEAGAVDYIVKPVIPDVLSSKVAVFIELDEKNAALAREVTERKLAEEQLRKSEENLRALVCSRCGRRSARASRARCMTSWARR